MIKNDWQLRVTQKRIKDFEDALFELQSIPESKTQPWLRAAQKESLQSELKSLRKQVEEYGLLASGKVALPGSEVIQQVPDVLIKTRISKGLTQEELAAKLGVSKQCVQQYEQTNYAHVTLSTAQHVMGVLLEHNVSRAEGKSKNITVRSTPAARTAATKKAGTKLAASRKAPASKKRAKHG